MHTITLVHQGALGDTLLLLPLISSLRARFPQASITLVSKTNLGQMLTMLSFIDAYHSADDQVHTQWFAQPESAARPNSLPIWASADLLLCAVASEGDAWGANARLARKNRAPDSLFFFDPHPPADFPRHITDFHREQLASLALPEPALPLARVNPDGPILIHPGSGGDAKCWPRERFISLAHSLKRNGLVPTFILGEAEQERWGNTLINQMRGDFNWYLHMGLFELADRMTRARVYLGNDSGVTHLAAVLGIPTLALFGPSNDTQWHPVGPATKILRPPVAPHTDLQTLDEHTVLTELLAELRKI